MLSLLKANNALTIINKVIQLSSLILFINNVTVKKTRARQVSIVTFLFALLCMPVAYSQEEVEYGNAQGFQLHGFLSQGVIDVNGSDFVNDSGKPSTELTEIGVNASYQLSDKIRVAGQVVYLNGGNRYPAGVRLDYALIDWSAFTNESWQVNLYAGRTKNNHWLYSSSRDIPFARPSIILPQSVYFDGFRDIAVGSDGVAGKVSYSDDDYGNFDFQISYGKSPLSVEQTQNILGEYATGIAQQEHDAQASLYWQPAFSAWRFGMWVLDASFTYNSNGRENGDRFNDGDFFFHFYTLNAIYEGETWEFSGEVYQQDFIIDNFYFSRFELDNTGRGFYLQTRYKLNQQLTFLARYENFYLDKDDKRGKHLEQNTGVPNYFGYHQDTTLGLNYDITSDFAFRLEYHWVQGNAKLTPVVAPNVEINNSKYWNMWALQFMYWF